MNVRHTRQRQAITGLLGQRDEFASAQTLHDELKRRGDSVGLTTVYRNLAALAAAGEVDVLTREDGETLYRRCSSEHHHHLVCRRCGATVEIAGPTVETWADSVAAAHGYSDVAHTIELLGTCANCATS